MTSDRDETDTAQLPKIRLLWVGISLAAATAFIGYVTVNQVGPRWFWSNDACAETNVVCGQTPLVMLVAAVGAMLMIGGGITLLEAVNHG